MMKKYKGFYPSWYIKNQNVKNERKIKKYLMFLILINLFLLPKILKTNINENKVETVKYESIDKYNNNLVKRLNVFLNNNFFSFNIVNNRVEFKLSKEEFIDKLNYLKNNMNIYSVKEIAEEGLFLVIGEFI